MPDRSELAYLAITEKHQSLRIWNNSENDFMFSQGMFFKFMD